MMSFALPADVAALLVTWRVFKQAGIVIPYPQRDSHIRSRQEGLRP